MKRKGRDHHFFRHGGRAGLTEYRYGEERPPVTLAGSKPVPALTKGKREHVVQEVIGQLRQWHLSPFEKEGPVRHGLRQALCLSGTGWPAADLEAERIVGTAFLRLGAKRPTWEQGQPEYVTPRENCRRCGGAIPDDLQVGDRNIRFCSRICAKAAIEESNYEGLRKDSEAYQAAWTVIQRSKSEPVACGHCKREFRPPLNGHRAIYCSKACAGAGRIFVPERPCGHCGTLFRPVSGMKANAGMFCSRPCVLAARSSIAIDKTCACCGEAYIARSVKALYCSHACAQIVSRFRTGTRIPKTLSAPVFDYVVKLAA